MKRSILTLTILMILLASCTGTQTVTKTVHPLNPAEQAILDSLHLDGSQIQILKTKPMYEFTSQEVDAYLQYLHAVEPDLRKRIQYIGRKFLNQPYEIYLLGEYPFDYYDDQPLVSIGKSDCVVFSEHTYAMALAHDWKSFMFWLQRIRYRDGEIGLTTRNHYAEYDWDRNNSWLVTDITAELAGEHARYDTSIYNKNRFFSKWGLTTDIPVDTLIWDYIPYQMLPDILDSLQTGDFVNIVRGYPNGVWVGHTGLVSVDEDGTVNFLHSTPPKVKEQPITEYRANPEQINAARQKHNDEAVAENLKIRAYNQKLAKSPLRQLFFKPKQPIPMQPLFYGFRFLRLNDDPVKKLYQMEGEKAFKVGVSYSIPVPIRQNTLQQDNENGDSK